MFRRLFASNGQSLLEIVVLVGLAAVIVTGLTIVTVNGLKNSQFSQNQAQATRLAQDGIDKIRTMRDQNCPVCLGGNNPDCSDGTFYYWYNNNNLIWSQDPASYSFSFQTANNPSICGPQQPNGIYLHSQSVSQIDSSLSNNLQTTFQRKISITGTSPKNVFVVVSWTDISGTHKANLATIIGDN